MAVEIVEETRHAYEHPETRALVDLVTAAAERVRAAGEAAFAEFGRAGSRWRQDDAYVFVLDEAGNMLVHPDAALEGKNTLALKDVNGKAIVRGLIAAATVPGKPDGWYHYEWPVPGGLLPRWKSSYVRLVTAASGASYIVGSGMYNDRMERAFVVDLVAAAVAEIETRGEAAFVTLRDPTNPFVAKDAYVFVLQPDGIELVNPAFPNLEGENLIDVKDTEGKTLIREMFDVVAARGSGWVDYMWPKPGESVSTQKSAYVAKATLAGESLVVGCGVYLADAPKAARTAPEMTASELMQLVRDAAAEFEKRGETAYPDFRARGSRWYHDDIYFVLLTRDGTRVCYPPDPASEGINDLGMTDVLGRPFGRMMQDIAATGSREGWVHYMFPRPGNLFAEWKSAFVKLATFPDGTPHLVVCGVYNMAMSRELVEDVVNRAADLVGTLGKDAFPQLRDRKGPFRFMDTYVFVQTPGGTELVNPAQPSLEGRNLLDLRDLKGTAVIKEEIALALEKGSGWFDCYWYKPGDNTPALKRTFVRKVQAGPDTFIVGSGIYLE